MLRNLKRLQRGFYLPITQKEGVKEYQEELSKNFPKKGNLEEKARYILIGAHLDLNLSCEKRENITQAVNFALKGITDEYGERINKALKPIIKGFFSQNEEVSSYLDMIRTLHGEAVIVRSKERGIKLANKIAKLLERGDTPNLDGYLHNLVNYCKESKTTRIDAF